MTTEARMIQPRQSAKRESPTDRAIREHKERWPDLCEAEAKLEGRCDGCGPHVASTATFRDLRTGRTFCHNCIAGLVGWEMDGYPEPDEYEYADWLAIGGSA